MRAMILGAGIGSRLDPLTRSLPKPLVPVVGKPVIGHLLDHLKQHGMTEVVINVQYLGQKIMDTLGDGSKYGSQITYSVEDQLWGDAGGCKIVEQFFRDDEDDTFLVTGGDDLTDIDLSEIIRQHREKKAVCTIGVIEVADPSQFGIVVHDENGFITRFQEKPKQGTAFSNLANTGIYVFSKKVFDYIPEKTFFGFGNNVLPALLAAGEPMVAVPSSAYWQDVGNLAIYRQSQRDCMDGKIHDIQPGGELRQTANGPVMICDGAEIDSTAVVEDYSVVGRNCVVGAGVTLKSTILWDGAVVEAGTYLENCVVGEGVRVKSSHGIFQGLIVEPKRPA